MISLTHSHSGVSKTDSCDKGPFGLNWQTLTLGRTVPMSKILHAHSGSLGNVPRTQARCLMLVVRVPCTPSRLSLLHSLLLQDPEARVSTARFRTTETHVKKL